MTISYYFFIGEYWVVGVDIEQYDEELPDKYLRGLLQQQTDLSVMNAYRSYFSIVASASINFKNFTRLINEYRQKAPFNFTNPLANIGGVVQVTMREITKLLFITLLYHKRMVKIHNYSAF